MCKKKDCPKSDHVTCVGPLINLENCMEHSIEGEKQNSVTMLIEGLLIKLNIYG